MAEAILIPFSFFLFIFAMVYLYFMTRNKERMALIEKGAEASIFFSDKKGPSIGKIVILNLALLLIGVGIAIFIGAILENMGVDGDVAYPGTIFFMAGVGLLTGFFLTKKMGEEK